MTYNLQLELDNNMIDITIKIVSENEMRVEANDPINYHRWQSTFDYNYFSLLAQQTILKDPRACSKIVYDSLKLKKGCEIKLTYVKDVTQKNDVGSELLLIFSINIMVKIALPFKLEPKPYSTQELVDIIKDLKKTQGPRLDIENQLIQKQLYEQSQAFFAEKQDLIQQIQMLQDENEKLKEDLSKKERIIKSLQETSHSKIQQSSYVRRAPSPHSSSIAERQTVSPRTRQTSGPYKTVRSGSSNSRNASAKNSRNASARSSSISSRNNSAFNSRNSSRNSSVQSSRRNSVASSSNNSRSSSVRSSRNSSARSSRGSTPTRTNTSYRSEHIPLKRFDPTAWKKQRDARRSASPARKTFY